MDNAAPQDHATTAAEAVRALIHATRDAAEIDVSDAYRTLGELTITLQRVPQAIGQLEAALQRRLEQGHLGHDADGDVGVVAR